MRILITFFSIIVLLQYSTITTAQQFPGPAEYLDYIVVEQEKILASNIEYITSSVHGNDWSGIDYKRKKVIQQLNTSAQKIQSMPSYKGNTQLKEEANAVITLYLETFKIEFNEALNLKKASSESYEAMEKYLKTQNKAEKKLKRAGDKFAKAQERFAKKYGIELVESKDDMGIVAEKISAVNAYSSQIFLIQFKVAKDNAAFLTALNEQKSLSVLERRRQQLEASSEEAKAKLAALEDYNKDKSLKESADNLVGFYADLAKNAYKTLTTIKGKREKDLTKEDVDAYNEAIQSYNTNAPQALDAFSKAQGLFLQNHIPGNPNVIKL